MEYVKEFWEGVKLAAKGALSVLLLATLYYINPAFATFAAVGLLYWAVVLPLQERVDSLSRYCKLISNHCDALHNLAESQRDLQNTRFKLFQIYHPDVSVDDNDEGDDTPPEPPTPRDDNVVQFRVP